MSNGSSQNGAHGGASAASDAARQGILATQQGGRAASEALRRTSEVAADAVQRGSEAAGMEFVFGLCAFLPLLGVLVAFLPNVDRREKAIP